MTAITLATNKKLRTFLYALLFTIIGTMVLRSCSDSGFDFRTSARLGSPFLISDTTKPKVNPPPMNKYSLTGSDTLFRLLYFNITNPRDVTENQKDLLKNWINSSLKPDTTK